MGGSPSRCSISILIVAAAALILTWPALCNRYPLLYPDSINYLGDGHRAAQAILHLQHGKLGWMRSPLYSLGIFAVHWDRSPWPVVILQALVIAWILWLVCRFILKSWLITSYFSIITALAALTGLSWVTCWLLPDILGAACYLSIYLLVFARDKLSRTEAAIVACLLVWSANSHVTHLMLATMLCTLLIAACVLEPRRRKGHRHPERREGPASLLQWQSVIRVSALVATALALQITANGFLSGSWSITGRHPPFLTARLLGDGPARALLQQHCDTIKLTLCQFKDNLPKDSDEFLWGQGIMTQATPAQAEHISREELPLLKATLRAYPWQQLGISLHNFRTQLTYYDIEGFGNNAWAEAALNQVMPGADAPYHRSRQAHNNVPSDRFSDIQDWTIRIAVLTLCMTLPLCWRRNHHRLLALSAIVIPAVIANAFVTGVLSVADSRYQVRVIWLIPFIATLTLLQLASDRHATAA